MTQARILIADHTDLCHTLQEYLTGAGFEVKTVCDNAAGVAACGEAAPDVLILAEDLPQQGSAPTLFEMCREGNTPVIVIAATDDVEARLSLFEAGADDVLAKPFDPRELTARVGALLRRTRGASPTAHGDVIRFDNFEISQEKFELRLGGKKVPIPPKELQLLYCLASSPNRVFSREQLLEHVWDFAFLGDSRTVDVHIKRLREKLDGASPKWALKTVWGVGYKFEVYN